MSHDAPRLGRGLKSLMSIPTTEDDLGPADSSAPPAPRSFAPTTLPVDRIAPNPLQPRKRFDPAKLAELASSLRSAGMIQPVVVRQHESRYELVAGQRRWEAAKQAGLQEIPVLIRDASDEQMLRFALIENIHREDLNAIERAEAYRAYSHRFGQSADQLADQLGEDRTTVTNYIRLLTLPDDVKALVSNGQLSMGHARALLGLPGPGEQANLARLVLAKSLSVRQLETMVRLRKETPADGEGKADHKAPAPRPHIVDLAERLTQAVGTKVRIQEGRARHTGRITIEYYSLDDFDRIAERLGLPPE